MIEEEIRANHKTLNLIRQVLKDLSEARGRKNPADVKSVRQLSEQLAAQFRMEALGRRKTHRLPFKAVNASCPALAKADLRVREAELSTEVDK